jgi:microcystin-dependent protein
VSEPVTINKQFVVPLTGDLPGAWGTSALNPNFVALDGILGGFQTIGLTGGSLTLGTATGTTAPGAGPTQSQNALLRFTGALTSNAQVLFTLPGYYVIENLCSSIASWYVQLCPVSGTGNCIGAPDGQKSWIFFDGTNVDFVNGPAVGSYLDLAVSTSPVWFSACTVLPYLLCNGAIYTSANFTALANKLGSAFGGDGVVTFGVPDQQGRVRAMIDGTGTRLTNAAGGAGFSGATLGTSGGSQFIAAHRHTVSDPGHAHTFVNKFISDSGGSLAIGGPGSQGVGTTTDAAVTGITIGTTGAGAAGNIPPMIVGNLTFIKT